MSSGDQFVVSPDKHERGFVLDIQFTGEGEHALALHLVAESGDGEQIGPQRQLMPGE